MASQIYDIELDEGVDYTLEILWEDANGDPIDLTGYSAEFNIKYKYESTTVVDWSDYITLGGEEGTLSINVPASETTAMTFTTGVYDIDLTSGSGELFRLSRGTITINKEVA